MSTTFDAEYRRLNTRQKEAVDTTEGPVMVIAGPGTGKTQVISLRIGNILKQTDTKPEDILCLTFTNSGVEAMRNRLHSYIGSDAGRVKISTFHAFGIDLIEEFHTLLGLPRPPKLLDPHETLSLIDRILNQNEWTHIRPRGNAAMYFRDLKSLVSILIRERLRPEDLEEEIKFDINKLKSDPENVSSRGARKGELKMEVLNKIESLEKTLEVVKFYRLYTEKKLEGNFLDYDDILSNMVKLVTECDEARDTIRERYLYVLVDEHQDSSGVQNEFLKQVWRDVEKPNVFVVGDDRQLIYGFSGASLSYFEEFQETFQGTRVITLTDNYRSTQRILDIASNLLTSSIAKDKLLSQTDEDVPIELREYEYPRDEILSAGMYFKKRIVEGLEPEECALLVPKNSQVRSAAVILRDLGLPVSASGSMKLFSTEESRTLIRILRIINDPHSRVDIAEILLDPVLGLEPLRAHEYLHKTLTRELSVKRLIEDGSESGLLKDTDQVYLLGKKLETLINVSQGKSVYEIVQITGKEILLDTAKDHDTLVRRVEIVRSFLHLTVSLEESSKDTGLKDYIEFLERLEEYGEDIPLATFGSSKGVRIMTLHASKGLEFGAVWIAHMNERSLMSQKALGFTLPTRIRELLEEKDEAAARREVYVAITRAKRHCILSYARLTHKGNDERLARIVDELPKDLFLVSTSQTTEAELMSQGVENYVSSTREGSISLSKKELQDLVRENYASKKVSVTLLNKFYECPWKWYFESFLDMPEPVSEALEFGSVVHGSIEELLSLDKKPGKKDIDAAIRHAIQSCHISGESRAERIEKDARGPITRFVEKILPELYDLKESEKAITYKDSELPKLLISGKIDLVEYDGGGSARVTDFKTGKTRKASEIEKLDEEGRMSGYMRQLTMYSYLLHNGSKGRVEVETSRLYFVEEEDNLKACFETHINSEHIDMLLGDIKEYDSLMQSGVWAERKCYFKPRLGESECPYCKLASMYK
jgi:DNA helicase II / ATP-dependent DNA helicase PcrA